MISLVLYFISLISQTWTSPEHFEGKSRPDFQYPADSVISHSYDVLHYEIDIEVFEPFDTLAGFCTMTAKALETIDSLEFHLVMNMIIDSILVDGVTSSYTRIADTVYIALPSTYYIDEVFSLKTYYCGEPAYGLYSGNNGFFTHSQGLQVSKCWHPCFDWCWDKADSGVTQHITVPDTIYAVCNGLLTSIDTLSGNRLAYNWDHNHPIATDLISVAGFNYTILERTHNGYTLVYYAIQGYTAQAQAMLDTTEVVLSVYDTLIDIYPFADEKMGQCQVMNPLYVAAMENQTCIIYSQNHFFNSKTHSHEIGHMWWGDELTCINYAQLFLNEGTTSYYESLPLVVLRGMQGFLDNIIFQRESALSYDEGHHYPIINSPNPFGTNVYYKGAWVHHMLRNLMGDTLYFPAMREYYQTYRGGNASVSELMAVMESFYGDSLGWFFHQWLEETDYPLLRVGWVQENDTLTIRVDQVQTNGPAVFRIPVEFGIWNNDTFQTMGPFWMEDSSYIIVKANSSEPDSVTVDPNTKLYFKLDQCVISPDVVLLVDDDGTGSSQHLYMNILDDLEIPKYAWDVNQYGLPEDFLLEHENVVFWITGTRTDPLTADRRAKIQYAFENGTPVAIFSPKAPSQLQGTAFLSDTLGFTYSGGTTSDTLFQGVAGDTIGQGLRWFNVPTHNSAVLTPVTGNGTGCIYWNSSDFGVVRSDNFQTVFSSIDLQWVFNMPGYSTKMILIANILNYFGIETPVSVEEIAETPVVNSSGLAVRYSAGNRIYLSATSPVRTDLSVYDITGRKVIAWTFQGELNVEWTGVGDDGSVLPLGRYYAVMRNTGEHKQILYYRRFN